MKQSKSLGKPFEISKWAVAEAYRRVKANKGAAGVDGLSIEGFESNLKGNLYKVWNRMSGECSRYRSTFDAGILTEATRPT